MPVPRAQVANAEAVRVVVDHFIVGWLKHDLQASMLLIDKPHWAPGRRHHEALRVGAIQGPWFAEHRYAIQRHGSPHPDNVVRWDENSRCCLRCPCGRGKIHSRCNTLLSWLLVQSFHTPRRLIHLDHFRFEARLGTSMPCSQRLTVRGSTSMYLANAFRLTLPGIGLRRSLRV